MTPPGGLSQAVAFLTPFGGAATPTPAALGWFPVVGGGLGLALGGLWWAGSQLWPPAVAAAVVVAADLAVTGLLHLDGLVDSADGLLPHLPPDRRLAVMAEPSAGAFGVGVAVVTLVLRWTALAALAPAPLLLAALWCASRTAMAAAARSLAYARPGGGLASAFRGGSGRTTAAAGVILAAVLA
ncbi:MAG: adenosylcobinamide-GDP ribazoletransferase, partial [Acidimicrobiales bacterium]